jgi:two-component system, sensor histidine kinase
MNVHQPFDAEAAHEQIRKLEKINRALMGRVEKSMDFSGGAFSLFQTAILLEDKVKARTVDLEQTLENLSEAYADLRDVRDEAETAKQNLTAAIDAVSEGFALFDSEERLVMCNEPFRVLMQDVGPLLQPGKAFADIAGDFSLSKHLLLDRTQSPDSWCKQRIAHFRAPYATFTQAFSGDRWLQISNKKMASGATVIFQTDITDIVRVERVKHERELDEQSKLLQATIDHMPQGISMFSSDHVLRTCNRRFVELLALPVHVATQRLSLARLFQLITAQSLVQDDNDRKRLAAWLASDTGTSIEGIAFRRFDNAFLNLDAKVMPDGGLVLTFADVTAERAATLALREANETLEQRVDKRTSELQREIDERRAIEKELLAAKEFAEEANSGKTRFLAAASHDLLQPLNASRIFLSLLLESGLTARATRLAESADRAFGSVEQLLEALLDISRFETRNVETNVTSFDLGQVFDTLAAEAAPSAERKGLEIRVKSTRLWVRSDQALLRRIIQNFLSNAVRYTETGGVLLGARRRNGRIVIEVYDTGVGIPADKSALIFEEFKRLHTTPGGDTKAMGLGLAIVDRIAALLGHTVGMRSVLGQGSCFHLTLDAVDAIPGEFDVGTVTAKQRKHSPLRSAILIENDLQILAGMVELLETRNIKAVPTVSAEEASEAIDTMESIPDLIIADYHLDNGTGLDAIMQLRRKCGLKIPAVIVTANHSPTLKSELDRNDVTLLWKPIKPHLLFETIESVL